MGDLFGDYEKFQFGYILTKEDTNYLIIKNNSYKYLTSEGRLYETFQESMNSLFKEIYTPVLLDSIWNVPSMLPLPTKKKGKKK